MKSIGLLGAGTVGTALAQLLAQRHDLGVELGAVLVRDPDKPRSSCLPTPLLGTDADVVIEGADIVVELIGGVEQAGELMLRALAAGKRVVTANKAALAERWAEFAPYLELGMVYFEAAIMAGTPVVGPLTGVLRGSKPLELHAILNGTCNYILSQLEQGVRFDEALAEAQRLGYAEADPTLDIEGIDAAHKLTVLARLTFDPTLTWAAVRGQTEGITRLTPTLVGRAMSDGGRIRLVGSVTPEGGRWRAAVRPAYLPVGHPLASAASDRNGLYYRGDAVGEVFISGAGAGAMPTASAVLADIIAAARGRAGPSLLLAAAPVPQDFAAQRLGEVTGP